MHRFPQVALAQVETVFADTMELAVNLTNFASLHGIRVHVAAQHAGPYTGEYLLPKVGEFGVVMFMQDDANTGIWTTTLPSRVWNTLPLEVMEADPTARVAYTRDGRREVRFTNGDQESIWPDGSLLRVTHSKDGTAGNEGGRSTRTPMMRSVDEDPDGNARTPLREAFTPPEKAPVDVRFEHASGAIVTVTADGSFDLSTPHGHRFKLHDATEKARDPDEPTTVTGTPEEDADRVASEVVLESEAGHRIVFHDDPVQALARYLDVLHPAGLRLRLFDDPTPGTSRYARLEHPFGHMLDLFHDPKINANAYAELTSGGGHSLLLRDLAPDDIHVLLKTAAGHQLELRDTPAADARIRATTLAGVMMELHDILLTAKLATPGGRSVVLDDIATVSTLTDPVKVVLDTPLVELAGGGAAIARVGDAVSVDAGTHIGTITAGSSKVTAG